jgi:hypothetical protein
MGSPKGNSQRAHARKGVIPGPASALPGNPRRTTWGQLLSARVGSALRPLGPLRAAASNTPSIGNRARGFVKKNNVHILGTLSLFGTSGTTVKVAGVARKLPRLTAKETTDDH